MEEKPSYIVDITTEGEIFYLELTEYINKTHSRESADRKSDEVLAMAISLSENPHRGRVEERLSVTGVEHRFLVYRLTSRKTVKIIYFIDEEKKKVFVTDYFGTEMDDKKIAKRNTGE